MCKMVERVARAWASMDGEAARFDACKADHALDLKDGSYMEYMEDARKLMERAGLNTHIAALEAQLAAADAMADDLIAHRGPWMHAMTVAAHTEPEEGDYWRHERFAFRTTLAGATDFRAIRGGGNG